MNRIFSNRHDITECQTSADRAVFYPGRLLIAAAILLTVLLSGCVATQSEKMAATMAVPDFSPPEAAEKSAAGDEAASEMATQDDIDKRVDHQRRFAASFQDTDLHDALALLSKESGVVIIARQGVEGRVTADMSDKTLGEILFAMLEPLGLSAFVEKGIILVEPPKLITRTFYLNYINNKRASSSTTNASVSASSATGTSSSTSGSSSGSGSQGNVSVSTSGTSDFWKEVAAGLESIIFGGKKTSDKSDKKLVINEMAGVVYVTDFSDNMENVRRFLEDVERSVKRQVLIQAHIVEVSFDDSFSMGIDWNYIFNEGSHDWSFTQNLATPQSQVFQLNLTATDFTMLLDAMQENGKVNMMSSPKISTLNNQKAVIKLTTKEVTWITESITTGNPSVTQIFTNPQIDEVGLFLDVTPSISETGRVILQIHPSISEILKISLSPGLTNSSKPVINVREVDTIADVENGQTVVIAGLISDRFSNVETSVPILGDIPLLGRFFSHLSQEKTKVELVIFLTPYVMDGESIDRIRQEHEGRLDRISEIDHLPVLSTWRESL